MIKSKECAPDDVERQLTLQLQYDPDCTVISIFPIEFKPRAINTNLIATMVKIIWNSK